MTDLNLRLHTEIAIADDKDRRNGPWPFDITVLLSAFDANGTVGAPYPIHTIQAAHTDDPQERAGILEHAAVATLADLIGARMRSQETTDHAATALKHATEAERLADPYGEMYTVQASEVPSVLARAQVHGQLANTYAQLAAGHTSAKQ